jgi:hypothetical protein
MMHASTLRVALTLISLGGALLNREATATPGATGINCASCHGPVPSVTPSNRTLAFGNVLVGSTKSLTLTIADTASRHPKRNFSLQGTFPAGPSGFTRSGASAYSGVLVTGAKKSESRTYTFAPTTRGARSGTGTLVANSGEPNTSSSIVSDFTISFSGRGVAPVSESTGSGAAGNVRIGTSATIAKTLKNIGDGNLSGVAATTSNLIGSVTAPSGPFGGTGGSVSLADGASRNFNFTFTPTGRGPKTSDALAELSNGNPNGGNSAHTITWTLSGTGVGPDFRSDAPPTVPFDFGAVPIGGAVSRSLRISNATPDGNLGSLTDLTILSVSFGGPDAGNFSLPAFSPVVIPGGGANTLALQFSGIASAAGNKQSLLTLTTDQGAAKGQPGLQFRFDLIGFVAGADPPADFTGDGSVNSEDLAAWRLGFSTPAALRRQGDANGDGNVDGHDFLEWQRQLGNGATVIAAPEPGTAVLMFAPLATTVAWRRRRTA